MINAPAHACQATAEAEVYAHEKENVHDVLSRCQLLWTRFLLCLHLLFGESFLLGEIGFACGLDLSDCLSFLELALHALLILLVNGCLVWMDPGIVLSFHDGLDGFEPLSLGFLFWHAVDLGPVVPFQTLERVDRGWPLRHVVFDVTVDPLGQVYEDRLGLLPSEMFSELEIVVGVVLSPERSKTIELVLLGFEEGNALLEAPSLILLF